MLRYVQIHDLYPSIERRREALAALPLAGPAEALPLCDARTLGLIASFQRAVVEDLKRKTFQAAEALGAESILVSGGVAANRELRERFTEEAERRGLPIAFPTVALSTDNAAMIAAAAWPRFLAGELRTPGSDRQCLAGPGEEMILKIRAVGEPVLRGRARPLRPEEILLPSTQELIASMRETMHDAPGVGLAAPQVGLPLQLAVIEDREEYMKDFSREMLAERERKPVAFEVIINPVLTLESAPEVEFFEGCLSLPGLVALVPRARKVKVECLDAQGQAEGDPGLGLARAHPAARDRSSVGCALCGPHAQRESLYARELHPPLEGKIHCRSQAAAA